MNEKNIWIDEARQIVTQLLLNPETKELEINPTSVEGLAQTINNWIEAAAQNQRNTDYYRGLVVRCGEAIGKQAFTQDDGGLCEDVLCAKVPALVESIINESTWDKDKL